MASRVPMREETGLLGHWRCAVYGRGRAPRATALPILRKSYLAQDPEEIRDRENRNYMKQDGEQAVPAYVAQGAPSSEP
jgi:hypothetical protein